MTISLFFFIFLTIPWSVFANPGGAPNTVCTSMSPKGGMTSADPRAAADSPYELVVTPTAYNPGETLSGSRYLFSNQHIKQNRLCYESPCDALIF